MKTGFLYQYYYLWSVALLLPLWAIIFLTKKRSRREMIFMGIFGGVSAMQFDQYSSFHDYWQPPTLSSLFNFESFLYGFFAIGITAKIYELVTAREYVANTAPSALFAAAVAAGNCVLFFVLGGLFQLNSVTIYIFMLLISTGVFLSVKPGLYKVCFISGVLMTGVTMIWYGIILAIYPEVFDSIWLADNLSGTCLFGVPIEEHLFAFAAGCSGSLFYKAATGIGKKRASLGDPWTFRAEPEQARSPMAALVLVIKIYGVPLLMLSMLLGRMVIFGDTGINMEEAFRIFRE